MSDDQASAALSKPPLRSATKPKRGFRTSDLKMRKADDPPTRVLDLEGDPDGRTESWLLPQRNVVNPYTITDFSPWQ